MSTSELSESPLGDYRFASQTRMVERLHRSTGEQNAPRSKENNGGSVRRSQKGIKRGPRKPLEPSEEFKSLHEQATMAFVDTNYELAEQLTLEAIRINSEMYAAYSLLAEIYTAQGDHNRALTALFTGAHTRSRDLQVWLTVGQLFLARAGVDNRAALAHALYCYNRIVSIEPTNTDHRHQRATLNKELGYNKRAAKDFERLLKLFPHNLTILRSLAEIYTDSGLVPRAAEHYHAAIQFYQLKEPERARTVSWSDVNIYVEIFADQGLFDEAIRKLKSLSYWLLGYPEDAVLEKSDLGDRESDGEVLSRRVPAREFQSKAFPCESYEMSIPLELRVKLGVYRLRATDCQVDVALVSLRQNTRRRVLY